MALVDQIISAESGGNPNARNSLSSAGGAGQFIDSTWLSMLRKHRPDIADGKSDSDLLALKFNLALSKAMTAAYAADNAGILQNAGVSVTPGSAYLAHFAGPQGAVGILNADPATPVASILTPAAVKANPFLQGMTAGDLAAWANRKVGGASAAAGMSVPSTPQQSAAPVASAVPAASSEPEPQDNSAQALASIMASMSQPEPAPMLLPMRKQPQLAFNYARKPRA